MTDASEVAFVLAQLVGDRRVFCDDAARDLHRMLGHRIAVPSPGELRYDRLQLLLTMLLETASSRPSTSTKPGAPPTPTPIRHRPHRP